MVAEYKTSLIVYYDILGFKEIVKTKTAQEVGEILTVFKEASNVSNDEQDIFEKRYTNFSDTVIISINVLGKNNIKHPPGILFHELMNIVHVQNTLIQKNVFLRGVITFGDIFHEDNLFYGPGVITAYEQESTVAIYPRIILDPAVLAVYLNTPALKADHHDIETDKKYVRNLLRKSSDGIYFVDYLKAFKTELDDPGEYKDVLLEHKSLVVKNAKKFLDMPAISSIAIKYAWLAEYHNQVVAEQIQPKGQSSFLITQKDIPSLQIL